jgi:hypothetical protein
MTSNHTEKKCNTRELLLFWAGELLLVQDEAERK